jgi:hypothetical protein
MKIMNRMTPDYTRSSRSLVALLSLAGASLLIVFLFDPAHYHFYPACYFHLLTGLYCPGCGALRATHHMLHGNFAAAFRLNLLVVLALPAAVLLKVLPIRRILVWIFLGACAAFTVARNVPGGEWLSP